MKELFNYSLLILQVDSNSTARKVFTCSDSPGGGSESV